MVNVGIDSHKMYLSIYKIHYRKPKKDIYMI